MCKKAVNQVTNAISPGTGLFNGMIGGGGSMPSVPNPVLLDKTQVPGMSQQELDVLNKMGINLDQLNSILSQDQANLGQSQNILKQFSGLYDASGNLDQNAVNALRQRILGTQAQTGQLSDMGYQQLVNSFNQSPIESASDQVGLAEVNRLNAALSGELTPNNAILNQEKTEYNKLKEAAGQRGIKIEGDDLYTATSQSTAGNQLLNDLRTNFSARRDTERQNIINQSTGANLNRLGFGMNQQGQRFNQAQSLITDPSAQTMGFLQNAQAYSPAQTLNNYAQLGNQYAQYANPYTQQRLIEYDATLNNNMYNNQLRNAQITGQYNQNLAGWQQQQQNRNAMWGAIGTVGGAMIGGPAGAAIGSQVGPTLANQGMGFGQNRAQVYAPNNNAGLYAPNNYVG